MKLKKNWINVQLYTNLQDCKSEQVPGYSGTHYPNMKRDIELASCRRYED